MNVDVVANEFCFVGILNHAWDGWRNETVVENYDLPFVDATLSD